MTQPTQATDADIRAAIHAELDRAGVTIADLRLQAATGRFGDAASELAWFKVSTVEGLA